MSSQPIELIACETCGGTDTPDQTQRPDQPPPPTRGQRLLSQLHASLASSGAPEFELRISSVRCLWACTRSCAVHLRGPGRVGYVLCELEPEPSTARALIEYARLYAHSSDGLVPLRQRPQALRGHFLCRIPATTPVP